MNVRDENRLVMVCAECLTAACWHGRFMCQEAWRGRLVQLPVRDLRKMGREHPDWWKEGAA
jgi:hypothetical protein